MVNPKKKKKRKRKRKRKRKSYQTATRKAIRPSRLAALKSK